MNNTEREILIRDAKELYNNGSSLSCIERNFREKGVRTSRQFLSKKFKSAGIEIINKQNISKFNINYFDNIDTEEKAYWLGFLFADGSVSSNTNTVELSLGLKDLEHLHKFKLAINSQLDVKTDHFRCRLAITNKHLKSILIGYGCTPVKSLTLKFPKELINCDMYIPFIRGYFDGDGCVFYYDSGRVGVDLIGTTDMLTNIRSILNVNPKLNHNKNHNENVFYIRLYGDAALNALSTLYDDGTIYLERKYLKYKNSIAVLSRNT